MKVLIGCEFSGRVRDAFSEMGHDAWSCDFRKSERPGKHIVGDVLVALRDHWDLLIAFPPCTHLCVSGAKHFEFKKEEQEESLVFVAALMNSSVKRIAIENPVGVISTRIRKPDQIIEPYEFGHGEVKQTCLWLKNLPKLRSTDEAHGRDPRVHRESPGPNREKNRSRTYTGVADAMARQWGKWDYPVSAVVETVKILPAAKIKPKRCPICKRSWNEQICNNCGYGF